MGNELVFEPSFIFVLWLGLIFDFNNVYMNKSCLAIKTTLPKIQKKQ